MSEGTKHDAGKPPMHLIDSDALAELARVLGFGAKKYSAHNWRAGLSFSRVLGAIMRHAAAINRGEDIDPETGLLHAGHLLCEAMFLCSFQLHPETYAGFDDRWRPAKD